MGGGKTTYRKRSTVAREVGKPERVTEEGRKAPGQYRNLCNAPCCLMYPLKDQVTWPNPCRV